VGPTTTLVAAFAFGPAACLLDVAFVALDGAAMEGVAASRALDFDVDTDFAEDAVAGLGDGARSCGDRLAARLLRADVSVGVSAVSRVSRAPVAEGFGAFRGAVDVERLSLDLRSCRCLLILLPPVPARDGCVDPVRAHVELHPPHPPRELCQQRQALRTPPYLDSNFCLCDSDIWQYAVLVTANVCRWVPHRVYVPGIITPKEPYTVL
jgi:hypothetical protein